MKEIETMARQLCLAAGALRQASSTRRKGMASSQRQQELQQEWREAIRASQYLERRGFFLRSDLSYGPPRQALARRLSPKARRALEYLLLEGKTTGLLTDAQHYQKDQK